MRKTAVPRFILRLIDSEIPYSGGSFSNRTTYSTYIHNPAGTARVALAPCLNHYQIIGKILILLLVCCYAKAMILLEKV